MKRPHPKKLITPRSVLVITSAATCLYLTAQAHRKNQASKPTIPVVPANPAPKTQLPIYPKEYRPEPAGPLTKKEKEAFFSSIGDLFDKSPGKLDGSQDEELMALNLKGQFGVDAILGNLGSVPANDAEIVNHMHLVSYLRYRCKFDAETRTKLAHFLLAPLGPTGSLKEAGASLAERAELLGALARYDWAKAEAVLRSEKNGVLKELMANEAYYNLKDKSGSKYAFDSVSEVVPSFMLPEGEKK